MGNLLRMDLYRMRKGKAFWVCLILTLVTALAYTPLGRLIVFLASLISEEAGSMPATKNLSEIISDPFPMLNAMLIMLSACSFFYADVENGYIKNIAGQMPKKGYTILSKFLAIIPHNLLFMLVGVIGNLLGTVLFQKIVADAAVADSIRIFALKFLLLQAICCILLLVTSSLRSKSLGMVLAVLFGMGLLWLVYMGIDAGLAKLLPKLKFSLSDYMPDQLLREASPKTLRAVLVSAVTVGVFLPLSIRVFDKKDVK